MSHRTKISDEEAVAIVGAGIAGLTAAVALSRLGVPAVVLERGSGAHQGGGALMLATNAVLVLERLGLERLLADEAAPVEQVDFRSCDGEILWSLSLAALGRRYGADTVVVPRSVLVERLAAAVAPGALRFGVACLRFDQEETGVRVHLSDGSRRRYRALVGADGFGSSVRRQLLGDEPPRPAYQVVCLGIGPSPPGLRSGLASASVGRGPRFFLAPLTHGRVYWAATLNDHGDDGARHLTGRKELLEHYRGWHAPIEELIATTPDEGVIRTRIRDRPPAARWSRGRVTLLGDAAQPHTPDLGQGACQAMESALALARCLAVHADPLVAFRHYEARRMRRSATISGLAWLTAMGSAGEDPIACRVRDLGIRHVLPAIARRELANILGEGEASRRPPSAEDPLPGTGSSADSAR